MKTIEKNIITALGNLDNTPMTFSEIEAYSAKPLNSVVFDNLVEKGYLKQDTSTLPRRVFLTLRGVLEYRKLS